MQVNRITSITPKIAGNNNKYSKTQNNKPAFKSLGTMADGFSLGLANLVENGGLFISFTIQDMLGTNLPRPIMGLMRNQKENKGHKNLKFAFKELVREMLTGPSMFFIPMMILGFGKKPLGSASNIPAKIIKGLGDIHMAEPLRDGRAITQSEFYQNAFTKMLQNAKQEASPSEATVNKALDYTQTLIEGIKENQNFHHPIKKLLGKAPLKRAINNIGDDFAVIAKEYADDLVHGDFTTAVLNSKAQAPIKDTIPHIISYADDIVSKAEKQAPENINKFIEKIINKKTVGRVALNAAMFAAVLSFLQVIPKIYNKAEGNKNEGLRGLMKEETLNDSSEVKNKKQNKKAPTSFGQSAKAKNPSFGSLQSAANTLTNNGVIGKIAKGIEFDGYNLSFPLLLGVMCLGILFPRIRQAKDKYDREEIIRRDAITCTTMCFAEKWLRKGFSKINESKSGFILTEKGQAFNDKNVFRKVFDYLRPIKGVQVLSTDQIISKYSNIDRYKNGIDGFFEFIEGQGGNIKKVFSTDNIQTKKECILGPKKFVEEILKATKNKTYEEATSEEIKEVLKTAAENKDNAISFIGNKYNELINLLSNKDNALVHRAKTLNARFTALSIVLIVPLFLGFALPAINEYFTKKRIRQEMAEKELALNNAIQNSPFNKEKTNSVFAEIANKLEK